MTTTASDTGVGEIYNFWLGLIPHFFAQLGTGLPQAPSATSTTLPGLAFPADQVARAANMTLQSLQALAQAYTPMLQAAGAPGLLGQWAAAMPFLASTDGRPA